MRVFVFTCARLIREVQVLDVRHNKSGVELGHALGKVLAANSSLLELQVDGNQIWFFMTLVLMYMKTTSWGI